MKHPHLKNADDVLVDDAGEAMRKLEEATRTIIALPKAEPIRKVAGGKNGKRTRKRC